jgi:hypothetical protein
MLAPRHLGHADRFAVVRKLGEGGMGAVYEALDQERGERIALKLVSGHDATALQRFKNEFRALSDLEHPNLVRLGELHEVDGEWFITMELVAGTDLLSYVTDGTRYDEARLRASLQQLALGLRALHAAGKVHRDIKPSNVRVTPDGRVVILDFGLVIDRSVARMSTEGNIVGTVAYMAPEQAAAAPIEASADWYAFGVVLHEALTGTVPFEGNNLQVLLDKLRITPPPPRARVPDVPADLDELCVELLRVDPALRPRGEEVLRRLGVAAGSALAAAVGRTTTQQTDTSTFVGRSAEFGELDAAFAQVEAGRTMTVSVEGPSGIGKSALVTRFVQQLSASTTDALVVQGRCYERETARFKALDGVIDALATVLVRLPKTERAELVPRNAALLRQLFPVLGRVDAIARAPRPAVTPRDTVEERRWMFASLRELLAKLGERRPLVLVIDDMHWADGDSLEILRVLLDASHEPPPRLLLLVTARIPWLAVAAHDEPEPWPVELRALQLAPLDADDARWLAHALLERHGTPSVDVEMLVRESRGHPLFVAELTRHAAARQGQAAAPLTLDRAIWERARALPEPALRVLRVLAVAASPLPLHILELATGLAPTLLERQLGLLRLEGFARSATGRDQRRLEPHHDRVREAVLNELKDTERQEVHATLAPLLEQEPGADLETVAQHYLDAGDPEKACILFERAARRAEEGFAFERAALLYRMQLTLRALSPAEQSELHRKVGSALARAGQGRAAADAYAAAIEHADDLTRINLRYLAAANLVRSGYVEEGLAAFEQVLAIVGLRSSRSRLSSVISYLFERMRRRVGGYQFTLRDLSSVPPQLLARADALICVAQGLIWVDGLRAAPLVARAVRAALATGERVRLVKALAGEASFMSMLGHRQAGAVHRVIARMRDAAGSETSGEVRGYVAFAEALVARYACQFKKLHDKATEAATLFEQSGAELQWERASARMLRTLAQGHLGRLHELAQEAPETIADARARQDRWLASYMRLYTSLWCSLRMQTIDFSQVLASVDEAYLPWRGRHGGFMHGLWVLQSTFVDVFEQRGDRALSRLGTEHAAVKRSGTLRVEALRVVMLANAGTAHLLEHLAHPQRGHLPHVLQLASRLRSGPSYALALSELLRAQVALAQKRDAEALALARQARARFSGEGTATQEHAAMALEGRLLGGSEGSELERRARAHFSAEGVARPEYVLEAIAPLSRR